MPKQLFDSASAREAGKRSGKARRRLTLERVEAELGLLDTVEDAMRRLDRLGLWISAGMLSGSQGGAAVRSIEVWLRGHETRLTERVVDDLQADVERLKAELHGEPRPRGALPARRPPIGKSSP